MNINLPERPQRPVKGRGYSRVPFKFARNKRVDWPKAAFWDALPACHKCEISTRRRGGYFRPVRFVSAEAYEAWMRMQASQDNQAQG